MRIMRLGEFRNHVNSHFYTGYTYLYADFPDIAIYI